MTVQYRSGPRRRVPQPQLAILRPRQDAALVPTEHRASDSIVMRHSWNQSKRRRPPRACRVIQVASGIRRVSGPCSQRQFGAVGAETPIDRGAAQQARDFHRRLRHSLRVGRTKAWTRGYQLPSNAHGGVIAPSGWRQPIGCYSPRVLRIFRGGRGTVSILMDSASATIKPVKKARVRPIRKGQISRCIIRQLKHQGDGRGSRSA